MNKLRLSAGLVAAATLVVAGTLALRSAHSSDHADTPEIAAAPGTDLTDVFIFPSATNSNNVVLAMCVSPLIPAGGARQFDPNVLYEFKIDNTGDSVEDLVIQAKFEGTGADQIVRIIGPATPRTVGTVSTLGTPYPTTGTLGTAFSPTSGMTVFAGVREDPFFFDLEQFFTIFPDRATPITGVAVAEPNKPQATTWRAPGVAKDFLKDLNVLAIVVELPKSQLKSASSNKIAVWCTTSK